MLNLLGPGNDQEDRTHTSTSKSQVHPPCRRYWATIFRKEGVALHGVKETIGVGKINQLIIVCSHDSVILVYEGHRGWDAGGCCLRERLSDLYL